MNPERRRRPLKSRLRERWSRVRVFVLEDGINGGPPNNWAARRRITTSTWGKDNGYYCGIRFGDDAGVVWLSEGYDGDGERWLGSVPSPAFRTMALWYLWRWAWGEWFGLRRRLYYTWLRHSMRRWKRQQRAHMEAP